MDEKTADVKAVIDYSSQLMPGAACSAMNDKYAVAENNVVTISFSGWASNHSIFRHDNFIGCFSADKIKMPARKYFCFNIPVYKNMVEESSCRSPYHEEYIRTGASGNPEGLCH